MSYKNMEPAAGALTGTRWLAPSVQH